MSIIQEALKRSEQVNAGPPPENGDSPTPAPERETDVKNNTMWFWSSIVLGALFLLTAAGTGVYLLLMIYPRQNDDGDGVAKSEREMDEELIQARDERVTGAIIEEEYTPIAIAETPVPDDTETPAVADDFFEITVDIEATGFTDGADPVIPVIEPQPVAPSEWPDLRVSGIMATETGIHGKVRIDGKLLEVGDVIEGVSIIRIAPGEVLLEFDGRRRVFRSGQTTGSGN